MRSKFIKINHLSIKPMNKNTSKTKDSSQTDRLDVGLYLQATDINGKVVSEWKWKVRCPDLLQFTKDMHRLYLKHHPGELSRKPIQTINNP